MARIEFATLGAERAADVLSEGRRRLAAKGRALLERRRQGYRGPLTRADAAMILRAVEEEIARDREQLARLR